MSPSLVQALVAHTEGVFTGPNGDYAATCEALAGLTAAQALWRPAPTQNSIWRIVEHLIASNDWLIEFIERGQATSPAWVEPAEGDAAWQATLARLQDSHRRLKGALEHVAEADLLLVEPQTGRTLLELLLSSGPAHEAHHGGQIDYLKGLQKA